MQANIRDQQEQSSSSIFYEGLQLLMECKVPDFSSLVDPDDRAQMQRGWSERLLDCLTEFVDFVERHQETLFFEDCGLVSGEFRKHFLLVYFEQVTQKYENGWFQVDDEMEEDIEYRLSAFSSIIESILYDEEGTFTDICDWLLRRYRTLFEMEGWQDRAEEVYSFVRLFYFLADFHHREEDIRFGPPILSFVERFGKQLLACRHALDYQILGLQLLGSLIRHTCEKQVSFRYDSERIMELALPLILKELPAPMNYNMDLWDVIFHSAKTIRYLNPSLDDEILRALGALLNENEDDMARSYVHLRTLTRLLLLDIPEVTVKLPIVLILFGRRFEPRAILPYVEKRLQNYGYSNKRRFSFHWRLRIGQIIPKLVARFCIFSTENPVENPLSIEYLKQLSILIRVVMFPIGQTWQRKRAQGAVMNCLLSEIGKSASSAWEDLDRNPSQNMLLLQNWHDQHNVLENLAAVAESFLESINCLQRRSEQIRSLIRSVSVQVMATHYALENLNRTLKRSINAAEKLQIVGEN